jgi:hypothetical protein
LTAACARSSRVSALAIDAKPLKTIANSKTSRSTDGAYPPERRVDNRAFGRSLRGIMSGPAFTVIALQQRVVTSAAFVG